MLRHRDTRRDVDGETDIQTGRQTVRRRLERERKTNGEKQSKIESTELMKENRKD